MLSPPTNSRFYHYWCLMRFDKPIGALLLLWPTLWALWIAGDGKPDAKITGIFIAGVFVMRAAGCIINDLADRHVDGFVARTSQRPLATGTITPTKATMLFISLCAMALGLVLLLNPICLIFSLLALATAMIYPFLKRITHLPQLMLGVAFSWGIPMAFVAQTGHLPAIAWCLFAANVLWTVAYDTQYAMVDRLDDLRVGIKSTAILFGQWDRLVIAWLELLALTVLTLAGYMSHFTLWYYVGIAMAGAFVLYQQRLIKQRQPSNCFRAFLTNQWFGCAVFVGIVANYYLPR